MKRRTPKPKHESAPKPVANLAAPLELDLTPTPEGPVLTETQDGANPPEEQAAFESFEISDELLQEIENFDNSFHVQRHPGTPPASAKAPAAIEPPSPRGAAASAAPSTASDRRANPRYAFRATAEVSATGSSAKSKTRVRDLSQQGCYLDSDTPLPLGTAAHVRITKDVKSLEVQGRVVYVQPGKGMGLMFTGVKPEHGGTLDTWINESRETSWLANNRRRSQRVVMKIPVRVLMRAGNASLIEEETFTLSLSAHGALISTAAPMYRGQRLTLLNLQTNDSLECVVAHIDKFPDEPVKVGVEFLLPNPHFWHVAFPPKDWSPHHADAKRRPR